MSVVSAANRVADEAVEHATLFWRQATAAMRPYRLTALAVVCGAAGWLTVARSGAIGWITVLVAVLAVAAFAAFVVRTVTLLRLRSRVARPGTRGIAEVRLLARSERALFAAVGFAAATIFLGAGQLLAIPVAPLPVSGFVTAFFLLLAAAVVLSQSRLVRRPQSAVTAFCSPRVEIARTPGQALAALRHRIAISRGLQEIYSKQGMSDARSILSIAETAGKGDGAAYWPAIRLSLFPSVLRGIVGRFAASVGLLRHALAAAILALIMAYIVPANALPDVPGPRNFFASANEGKGTSTPDSRNAQNGPGDEESTGGSGAQDDTGSAPGNDGADESPSRQEAASAQNDNSQDGRAQDGNAQGNNRGRDQVAAEDPGKGDGVGGSGASEAGDGASGSETSESNAGGTPGATGQGQEGSPGNSQGGGTEPNPDESGPNDGSDGAGSDNSGNQTGESSSSATSSSDQTQPTGAGNEKGSSTKPGNDGADSPGNAASSGSDSQNGEGTGDGKSGDGQATGANSNESPGSGAGSASSEPNSGGAGGAESQGGDGSQTGNTTQGAESGDTAGTDKGDASRTSGGSDAQSESGVDAGERSGSGQDANQARNPANPGDGEPSGQNPGVNGRDSAARSGGEADSKGSGDTKSVGDGGEGGADSGNQVAGDKTAPKSGPGNQAGKVKANGDQLGQSQAEGSGSEAQPNLDGTTDDQASGQSSQDRSGEKDGQGQIPGSVKDPQADPQDAERQSNDAQTGAAQNGVLEAVDTGAAVNQAVGSVDRENAQGQPSENRQAGEASGAGLGGSGEKPVAPGDRRETGGSESQTADPQGQPGGTNVQTETKNGTGQGKASPGAMADEVQGDPVGQEVAPSDGFGGSDLAHSGEKADTEDAERAGATVRLKIPGATAAPDQGAVATSRAPASPFAATGKAPETIEAVPQSSAALPDAPARALPPEQRLPSWVVDLFE